MNAEPTISERIEACRARASQKRSFDQHCKDRNERGRLVIAAAQRLMAHIDGAIADVPVAQLHDDLRQALALPNYGMDVL